MQIRPSDFEICECVERLLPDASLEDRIALFRDLEEAGCVSVPQIRTALEKLEKATAIAGEDEVVAKKMLKFFSEKSRSSSTTTHKQSSGADRKEQESAMALAGEGNGWVALSDDRLNNIERPVRLQCPDGKREVLEPAKMQELAFRTALWLCEQGLLVEGDILTDGSTDKYFIRRENTFGSHHRILPDGRFLNTKNTNRGFLNNARKICRRSQVSSDEFMVQVETL